MPGHGSSPRARGTPKGCSSDPKRCRFIPAGAGNTSRIAHPPPAPTVHPRRRGEHVILFSGWNGKNGSSPRARGTRETVGPPSVPLRFIPAGAGNTPARGRQSRQKSVHPRGRGEHSAKAPCANLPYGSSPRARGTLRAQNERLLHERFMPAGAGNTRRACRQGRPGAVHPRGRGEHDQVLPMYRKDAGSSPRARGTPHRGVYLRGLRRFVPAGAGNTTPCRTPQSRRPVHPRGRGEHAIISSPPRSRPGSSPRARGTQAQGDHLVAGVRFIPAGAGNTAETADPRSPPAVHPRGRGEHAAAGPAGGWNTGSSPRARGTLGWGRSPVRADRFIPAGAGNTRRRSTARSAPTVHPRGRGEHAPHPECGRARDGSSPRARGTRGFLLFVPRNRRFIPAGAGNTAKYARRSTVVAVHPRGRGEHEGHGVAAYHDVGSSPRARGTHRQDSRCALSDRFIPAGAGNTSRPSGHRRHRPVHPRGRGEHSGIQLRHPDQHGSSPRARGTLKPTSGTRAYRRFIPAGAGNTLAPARSTRLASVHPRGRGEHVGAGWGIVSTPGSSPRARGTHSGTVASRPLTRFIPAGAGNTGRPPRRCPSRPVHPRGRGEHLAARICAVFHSGSSPRARGTHDGDRDPPGLQRFIPAGAGNTTKQAAGVDSPAVHPRGRGEHVDDVGMVRRDPGSSPRARGTLIAFRCDFLNDRFIPAGAGNTPVCASSRAPAPVHPRGRGEHSETFGEAFVVHGSSPRARGTRSGEPAMRLAGRFIPAGAGNTLTAGRHPAARSVHPRGRGEHLAITLPPSSWDGSSPRARGTRLTS